MGISVLPVPTLADYQGLLESLQLVDGWMGSQTDYQTDILTYNIIYYVSHAGAFSRELIYAKIYFV